MHSFLSKKGRTPPATSRPPTGVAFHVFVGRQSRRPSVHCGCNPARFTALRKPNGVVRGFVVGDVIRRVVARTLAQQLGPAVEGATAPFLYALSTKAGCECVSHVVQALTEADPETTVVSIDGVSSRYLGVSCVWMEEVHFPS